MTRISNTWRLEVIRQGILDALPSTEICKELRCSDTRVRQLIRRTPELRKLTEETGYYAKIIEWRANKHSRINKDLVITLLSRGYNVKRCSKIIGCTPAAINWLARQHEDVYEARAKVPNMRAPKQTPEEAQAMLEALVPLAESGLTIQQMADEVGESYHRVNWAIRQNRELFGNLRLRCKP